jgi:hypothetical protein
MLRKLASGVLALTLASTASACVVRARGSGGVASRCAPGHYWDGHGCVNRGRQHRHVHR